MPMMQIDCFNTQYLHLIRMIFALFYGGKETSQELTQIYSQRKGADSLGGFEFERARKTNK